MKLPSPWFLLYGMRSHQAMTMGQYPLYPCRCLWRAFSQITRTIPLRRMIEHLGHIFLTDERTFIDLSSVPGFL
jgi:hypothetical protein